MASFLSNLPTPEDMYRERRGKPLSKGQPRQLAKEAKEKTKADKGKTFRNEVWARDGGKCRATGKKLVRTGSMKDTELGEVDHSIPRSLAPERIFDTSNGLLLQKRLNRLRKLVCRNAPEHKYFDYSGPDNRALPQTFVWRDDDGKITKTRIG